MTECHIIRSLACQYNPRGKFDTIVIAYDFGLAFKSVKKAGKKKPVAAKFQKTFNLSCITVLRI